MNLARIGLVMATLGLFGCSGSHSPSAPSASAAHASDLQPTITGISPNVVSTTGTAWGTIIGSQFQPGATVRIGNALVIAVFRDNTTIAFPNSGAHAAGSVDYLGGHLKTGHRSTPENRPPRMGDRDRFRPCDSTSVQPFVRPFAPSWCNAEPISAP